ncbi:hypothetical protein VTN00DRAFT_6538 [Thermoascus crustaceus]|uniref:uncharacterized protein n=1 Tax=Thermoascus crustaceus TaxID=5088 RepID=UPI003742AA73
MSQTTPILMNQDGGGNIDDSLIPEAVFWLGMGLPPYPSRETGDEGGLFSAPPAHLSWRHPGVSTMNRPRCSRPPLGTSPPRFDTAADHQIRRARLN